MANQLAGFDPVSRFQTAQSNAQLAGRNDFAMQQAQQNAPRQNALADIQLRQAQAGEQASIRDSGISIESQRVKFLSQFGEAMEGINTVEGRIKAAQILTPLAQKVGVDPSVFTPENLSDEGLQQLRATTTGFINDPSKLSAAQQEFARQSKGLSEQDINKANRIALGLDPRAVGNADQTITDRGNASEIGKTKEILSGATEKGKLNQQLQFKPQIAEAVKLAEKLAAEKGEVITDLARMEAALPGLNESVSQLKELALIATSTFGGNLFDAAVKQTGFGSTDGATAKAKFIAIVNNQVLPLLKQTFGGAFTLQEGESLKATMGDPNGSPAEKMAQLDAFIAQKQRDISSKKTQLGQESNQDQQQSYSEGQTATNPQTGQTITFRNGQWVGQ